MHVLRQAFVNGGWLPSHGTTSYQVVNPATEKPYAEVVQSDPIDVAAAVGAAERSFQLGDWRRATLEERCQRVLALRDVLVSRAEILAAQTASTLGQPLREARALGMVPDLIDMYVGSIRSLEIEYLRTDPSGTALVTRKPVGVVVGINPWNTPLRSEVKKAIPALLAGCSVVLKPAPDTPFGAVALAEAAAEVGLPPGVLNVVFGGGSVGEMLVRDPAVRMVAFTGSTATGSTIGEICGATFTRVELELGGKSAAVVLDDADLSPTSEWLDRGNFLLAGQVCTGLTRVLAPRSRYGEVVDSLVARADGHVLGDPFDEKTTMGPLVTAHQRQRVLRYIEAGRSEGAKVAVGGGPPTSLPVGWFVEPTVFVDVSNDMRIAQEEIFGPVVSVIPYDNEDQAIAIANDSPYGLHGAVFSADEAHALAVARKLETGSVGINRYGTTISAPFGGVKASGIGREHGPEGIEAFFEYVPYGVPEALAGRLSVPHHHLPG